MALCGIFLCQCTQPDVETRNEFIEVKVELPRSQAAAGASIDNPLHLTLVSNSQDTFRDTLSASSPDSGGAADEIMFIRDYKIKTAGLWNVTAEVLDGHGGSQKDSVTIQVTPTQDTTRIFFDLDAESPLEIEGVGEATLTVTFPTLSLK